MSSEYRNICDCCGKETKGFGDVDWCDPGYKELARQNWDIRIYSHWLEGAEENDLLSLKKEEEVSMDACLDCVRLIGKAIRQEVERIKRGIV